MHFNQPISTISPTSFVLTATGTAYGNVVSVSGSGQNYTVIASGLGGTGTVSLDFSATAPTDVAGNKVQLTTSGYQAVTDTTSPTTVVVSSNQSGVEETGAGPALSGDGRVVTFISDDPNLVPTAATVAGNGNVYVKDLQTGAITLVTNGNGQTYDVAISLDGTVLAFASDATNLVPGGTPDDQINLYVAKLSSVTSAHELSLNSIQLVGTLDANTAEGSSENGFALSGDGSTVAFGTDAELPGEAGEANNSYLLNLATGTYTSFPAPPMARSPAFPMTERRLPSRRRRRARHRRRARSVLWRGLPAK